MPRPTVREEERKMQSLRNSHGQVLTPPVFATGEEPIFEPGDTVRISTRSPVGHYRVPTYLRGRVGTVKREQKSSHAPGPRAA